MLICLIFRILVYMVVIDFSVFVDGSSLLLVFFFDFFLKGGNVFLLSFFVVWIMGMFENIMGYVWLN